MTTFYAGIERRELRKQKTNTTANANQVDKRYQTWSWNYLYDTDLFDKNDKRWLYRYLNVTMDSAHMLQEAEQRQDKPSGLYW